MSLVVIKNTLDDFFAVKKDEDNPNGVIVIDEVDTEILSKAIDEALEKEKTDENKNS